MIRIMAALLALAVFATPAGAVDRRLSVTDFDRVTIEGPYQVRLVVGRSSAATVSGSLAALDRVTVDVQGQTLRIRRNRSAWGGTPGADAGPVTIELATRRLRSARLVGPAQLSIQGAAGLNVDFTVEGSGTLRAANVSADNLALGLIGSGRLEIGGAAGVLRGDFQGGGSVDASNLTARSATVTNATSGEVLLAVRGPAAVTNNGAGTVRVTGAPVCTIRGVSAAQVICESDQRQHR
ncbi:MAG TPA: DUF2807 domain-containing protein [Allosphingosinicella sp.]|nr:DUF2807 domain-containing protein [Allosphingosinicella sp.]